MGTGTGVVVFMGAVSVALFSISVNRGLKMSEEKRLVATMLWYAVAFTSVAVAFLLWVQMGEIAVNLQRAILGVLGALIGAFIFIAIGEWVRPEAAVAQTPAPSAGGASVSNTIGNITNNQGIVTQGQTGGTNLVFNKPPARSIDNEFKHFIRTNFQDKSKEIAPLILTGDDQNERSNFSAEIEAFLASEGYKIRARRYFFAVGDVPVGVVFETETDPAAIIMKIGINNRK